jgi:hypothetical protein
VAVEVAAPTGVFVRRTVLVDVLVVLGLVRMIGVETEGGVVKIITGVVLICACVAGSVGGEITDSSVRGVVIAGSVPRKIYWNAVALGLAETGGGEFSERPMIKTTIIPIMESPPRIIGSRIPRSIGGWSFIRKRNFILPSVGPLRVCTT